MACRMESEFDERSRLGEEVRFLRAALCAMMRATGKALEVVLPDGAGVEEVIAFVDEREAGVSRTEITEWWEKHQREDAERIAREQQERERTAARDALIASGRRKLGALSPEEREALGIRANPL